MISSRLLLCTVVAATLSSVAMAKVKSVSLQDKQQAACYDDVQKLCKDALPDVDKVTACMETKKSQVSKKCAAMYDAQ